MAGELKVTCGQCKKVMQVPEVLAGKRIKCRGCSGTLMVPKPAPPKAAAVVVDENKKGGMFEQAVAYGVTKLDEQVRCTFAPMTSMKDKSFASSAATTCRPVNAMACVFCTDTPGGLLPLAFANWTLCIGFALLYFWHRRRLDRLY
ncbi:MAG: hypothetical protein QM703_00630 [Gemmatales bacterium]